jgi:signal transduction histidine kinase
MRLSVKIIIGFVVIIILSIISFFINLKLSADVNRNTDFLTNSESVIRNSAQIHKHIIEMQSGFRGFLLTNNEHFLEPYYEGSKAINSIFEEERLLISNSKSQVAKLDSIYNLHKEWIEYSNSLIVAKRKTLDQSNNFSDEYLNLFENKLQKEVGKKINDEISLKFKEFDRHEYQVRQERRNRLNTSIINTKKVSYLLAIVTLTVGLISAIFITHSISKRISSLVSLAEGISKGRFDTIEDKGKDELTDLSKSLNLMSEKLNKSFTELARKNNELDQFAYVVSHDLKAPLRGMYNIFNWIDEDHKDELSDQVKKYMEMLKGRIHRMESLITGLLEYARIGRVIKPIEKIDVKEMLNELVEMLVPPGFKVNISNNIPQIYTEKIRLQQVFSNLISNAVKYNGKESGKITIRCIEKPSYYEFSLSDNGIGISREFHEKIFGIFQTLREKNELESTGVGLAIVKKIIEDKKGTIKVLSEEGKGATFVFTWPKETVNEIKQAKI